MKTLLVALPENLIKEIQSAFNYAYRVIPNGDHRVAYGIAQKHFTELVNEAKHPAPIQPDIKISSHKVAVDQNYFWDLNMRDCPQGKVQLLSKGGLPCYGKPSQAPGFYVAWAALPKLPPHFNPEIFK